MPTQETAKDRMARLRAESSPPSAAGAAPKQAPETARERMARLRAEPEPTLGEYIVGSGKAFVRGAVETVSEGLRGAGKIADAMREIPGLGGTIGSGEGIFTAGGEAVESVAPTVDPRVAYSTAGQLSQGLGRVGSLFGIAAVDAPAAFLTAFLGGASETERQVAAEMTDEDGGAGLGTLLTGGAINSADMIPLAGPLARINRISGGALAVAGLRLSAMEKLAKSARPLATAGRIAETAALEAATEGVQKLLTNALSNHATGQELDAMRGVIPEAGMGGGIGAILATAVELATRRSRALHIAAAERGIPWERARELYRTDAEFAGAVDFAAQNESIMEDALNQREPVLLEDLGADGYAALPGERGFYPEGFEDDIDVEGKASAEAWERLSDGKVSEPIREPKWTREELDANPYLRAAGETVTTDPQGPTQADTSTDADAAAGDLTGVRNERWPTWRALFRSIVMQARSAIEAKRNEVLVAEDAALREQYPGKEEWWYEGVAKRREQARDPHNPTGDKAALELKRLKIQPTNAAVPIEMLDAALRLKDKYPDTKIPSVEKTRAAADEAQAQPEYRRRDVVPQDAAAEATQPQSPVGKAAPEQAAKPTFQPSPNVRASPSSQARVPVPGQAGPTGQPVFPITGQKAGMPWGGTQENVVGAKLPTSLADVGRALVAFGRGLGELATIRRNSSGNITGSFDAAGVMTADVNDVHALAHEAGHLAQRWVMANQHSNADVATNPNAGLDALPAKAQGEIRSLAYPGTAAGRELPEGFGELMRVWVMAPEQARAAAPQATQWLESWLVQLPPNVRAPLELAQRRAQDYRFQGDELRRTVKAPPTLLQRIDKALGGLPEAVVRRVYDDTRILRKIDPKLQNLWRSIRGSARGILTNFVTGRPTDFNGNEILDGINYQTAVGRIQAKDRKAFSEYIVARRTLALEGKGLDTGKAPAEALRLKERYDESHPEFAAAIEDLQKWWSQINRVLADASPTYAAGLARIAEHDLKHGIDFYAPLHRWLTGTERGRAWAAGRSANLNNVSRTQEGSAADVKDPLEAFVVEAGRRLEQAVYRNVIEQTISIFDATGGNAGSKTPYIREITPEEAGPRALDYGTEGSVESILAGLAGPEMQKDMIPARIIDREGKERFFLLDRRLAEVVAQVDPATLRNGTSYLVKAASATRRSISTAQIVMNPGFQFFTNVLLDTPMAYLVSSYVKPGDLVHFSGMLARNILDNMRSYVPGQKPARWVQAYENLGLHGSSGLAGERRIGRTVTAIAGKQTGAVGNLRERNALFWEGIAQFMSIPQRSVQITLMQKAAKAHNIDISQPITPDEANILRLAARQPVDYNAGGDLSRKWSLVVPFLRPALDSQRQLAEAARRNPIEFFSKVGVLMGMYTAMRYLFADDEIEQRKTGVDAMRSLSIPTGDGEAINLRIPGEIAWMVMAPTAVVESLRKEGQDPSDFVFGGIVQALPPGIMSVPLFNLLAQQSMNKSDPLGSLFYEGDDAPIVPNALKGMDGLQQQTPATAPIAIFMATAASKAVAFLPNTNPFVQAVTSPVRWESGLRSLVGGNGVGMTEAFHLIPALAPAREAEAADVLAAVYRRGGETSWNDRYIREVYELNRAAMQKKASLNGGFEDPMEALNRRMLARTAAALSTARFLSTYEAEGSTVAGRRALTAEAQKVAKLTIESTRAGKLPTHFYGLEATTKTRKGMYDIDRGAFFR